MSAPFVVHALSYCLGRGRIALKGRAMRPWLTLQRLETERTYLDHQQRLLRKLHEEPLQVHWDQVPGDGYYDLERVRPPGEALHQAYELLYPRDCWTLSSEVLRVCGARGLAALWIDAGQWMGSRPRFTPQGCHLRDHDFITLAEYLQELGLGADLKTNKSGVQSLTLRYSAIDSFLAILKPVTHGSMRHKLEQPNR